MGFLSSRGRGRKALVLEFEALVVGPTAKERGKRSGGPSEIGAERYVSHHRSNRDVLKRDVTVLKV